MLMVYTGVGPLEKVEPYRKTFGVEQEKMPLVAEDTW
jgi:hypothetical protein